MFRTVVCQGRQGSLLWGAGEAAVLSAWAVARDEHYRFTLAARMSRSDAFRLRQVPLLFTFPSTLKPAGLWCFRVRPNTLQITGATVTATLEPPERGR